MQPIALFSFALQENILTASIGKQGTSKSNGISYPYFLNPITHPRLSVSVKSVPWRTLAILAGVTGEGCLRATNGLTVLFGYGIETLTAQTFENAENARN
jgi:hypothetical protein